MRQRLGGGQQGQGFLKASQGQARERPLGQSPELHSQKMDPKTLQKWIKKMNMEDAVLVENGPT